MTRYRSLQRIIVPLILGLVCALLTGTLWMMADREKSTRALALEYRMHRTLSALAELWRGGPLAPEELESLLGFGLYSASGSALYRFGTAPETVDPQDAQKRYGMRFAQDAVSMLSILGRLNPARGMGSMMRPRDSTAPALAWIAVDALPLRRQRLAILLLAGFASAAIAGLFSFSMILYRRYEKSRERDERDRELLQLGQAARTIAHEIKNPLGIVRIQCGVLRKRDNADLAGLSIIEDEVDRLAVMADRIRQFLAGRTPQLSLVNACAFARDYAARYAGKLAYDEARPLNLFMQADTSMLSEALDNLVSNALDAHPGGMPELELKGSGRFVLVSVLDKGPGLAEPDRLFEPFYSTKQRGSGLGLALAKKHAQTMGGDLVYERRATGISAFTIRLQAATASV